jgi:6-hydroxycyclohex-1-ene-1-carbonyl-CoA dehydrogenase
MAFHAMARGNWGCVPEYYPAVLKLALAGSIQISPFVKTYPLAEINEVFEMVHHRKTTLRPVLVP